MGQYYNIIIKEKGQRKVRAYNRRLDGEYTMAKLTEHSWYLNEMCNAIAEQIYHRPSRIAWVGDYANEDGDNLTLYKHAWPKNDKYEPLHKTEFTLNGRFIVNHDKKLFLDCWWFLAHCIMESTDYDWIMHPLPLLVALGNGRGGGDYRGINADMVGCWAWDTLEIVDYDEIKKLKDKGYQRFEIVFLENI